MNHLPYKDIYLWKSKSSFNVPWNRKFLDIEFLKYEQKRIKELSDWYSKFRKSPYGNKLEEVKFFVLPIELKSKWKASIALKGNYTFFGLSALKNDVQIQLLMLIPKDKNPPPEFSFIRIINSRKDYLHVERTNEVENVLIIEEFVIEDPSSVYIDVPFERKPILTFIKENLINDNLLSPSFQSLLSSSPFIINKNGGLTMSTFVNKDTFSEELIKTLKLMQPPEFSDISLRLPPRLKQGTLFEVREGIKLRVAEINCLGNNFFSGLRTYDYEQLDSELNRRDNFNGEYSLLSVLSPKGEEKGELIRDMLARFVKTEITCPFNISELKYWDLDLNRLQREITEDLWLQVANERQINPLINFQSTEVQKLRIRLVDDWRVSLEEFGLTKYVDQEIRVNAKKSFENIIRVSQSQARDLNINEVNEEVLKQAYKLFTNNFEALVNNEDIRHKIDIILPKKQEDNRINSIRAELSVNSLDINELYNNLKDHFRDIYELQEYVDKLIIGGYIFEPKPRCYKWI